MSGKTAVSHKCPRCHATLVFNPKSQNWICEYCDGVFSLEDLKENSTKYSNKEVEEEKSDSDSYNVYRCPECGANIVTDSITVATFCVYCRNTSIIKERLVGNFEPEYILPFRTTNDDAIKAFKKIGRGHPLMPKEFSASSNISEIRGIYIPFWLLSSEVNGHLACVATRSSSVRHGDYKYITTKYYNVVRDTIANFKFVPNDGSKKFDDAIMNSIEPFDYKYLVDFSPSYLSGFLAEKYDVTSEEAKNIIDKRIRSTLKDVLLEEVKGYESKSVSRLYVDYSNVKFSYALLPVWLLNIKYKGKFYTFAMNGESGKLIGNIPVSKEKLILCFLLSFLACFGILLAIFYFFVRGNV